MKLILYLILLMAPVLSVAQTVASAEHFPEKYTLEQADVYYDNVQYVEALWFYVNLYPTHKEEVLQRARQMQIDYFIAPHKNLFQEVLDSFLHYDQSLLKEVNGEQVVDEEKLMVKWNSLKAILEYLDEFEKPLNSADEYAARSMEKYREEDTGGAIDDMKEAINLQPAGLYYYNLGMMYFDLDQLQEAIDAFNSAIEINYEVPSSYLAKGQAYAALNKSSLAKTAFLNAIEAKTDFLDAYLELGNLEYQSNNFEDAVTCFEAAIKIDPNAALAYANRGMAYQKLDKNKNACKDLQKAVDLGMQEAQSLLNKSCR